MYNNTTRAEALEALRAAEQAFDQAVSLLKEFGMHTVAPRRGDSAREINVKIMALISELESWTEEEWEEN